MWYLFVCFLVRCRNSFEVSLGHIEMLCCDVVVLLRVEMCCSNL